MNTQKSKQGGAVPRNRRKRNKTNKKKRTGMAIVSQPSPAINVRFSDCSSKYLKALSNPFMSIDNVCIPDAICLPSYKVKFTARGTFQTGTGGFGFVSLNPWNMVTNSVAVNANGTEAPIEVSTATYPLNVAISHPIAGNVGTAFYGSNSQYNTPALANGNFDFRLVGSGLRVRYIGTELNRGGRMTMFRNRNNTPTAGNFTMAQALTDTYYHTSDVSRQWKEITYMPSRTDDISYGPYLSPLSLENGDYRIMYGLIDGTIPGTGFEFEALSFFELVGGGVGAMLPVTQSHSDPVGFGAILSSIPSTLKETGSSLYSAMVNGASRALAHATSGIITYGVSSATRALMGPVGGTVASGAAGLLTAAPQVIITDADD